MRDSLLHQQITHVSELTFEEGLRSLGSSLPASLDGSIRLFSELCASLAETTSLGPVERERRAGLILRKAPTDPRFFQEIAEVASSWPADIKNAVTAFLPAQLKPLVYGKRRSDSPPRSSTAPAPETAGGVTVASPAMHDTDTMPEVLLVGTAQEHESNHRHLEREGYRPLRAGSMDEFRNLLNADVVGILVGRSWWAILPQDEHQAFAEMLFHHSSFTWLKIDIHGCRVSANLPELCRHSRFREPAAMEVVMGDSSTINAIDIQSLAHASQLIDNPTGIRLCPADIDPVQGKLLIGGIAQHVKFRRFPPALHLQEIGTATVQGGLSQALIVRAQPDDGGLPFIAKLADLRLLRDEMYRFHHFIGPWDNVLKPQLHYHGGSGLIIFGLVDAPETPLQPAPTLEDTLRRALLTESGGMTTGVPTEQALRELIERTITKIQSLNSRRCADRTVASFAWIDVESFDAMVAGGIAWKLPALPSGRDPLDGRHAAVALVGKGSDAATIHGDMHLRNVLVRDGREPFLIDYAYSGPGHPCFDLVRFSSAILFTVFRMTDDESRVRELLCAIQEDNATLETIAGTFPALCSSLGNRLAVHASISAKKACRELLAQYGLSPCHYHAMQLVVGCQSLTMPQLQTGIVRAAVSAAARMFEQS